MFDDVTAEMATEHADVLAALPRPLSPVCVRSLLAASAHDHRTAESHRKSSLSQRAGHHFARAARLIRSATIAEDRAAELLAEVR